jgi:hypothetical protein
MKTDQTTISTGDENLDCWALVEIFGHTKVAGRVTTRKVGVNVMIQVDVPKGATELSHSQMFSPAAVFSINPTTEAWCRSWAAEAAKYNQSPLPYIPNESPRLSVTSASESYGLDDGGGDDGDTDPV